MLIRFGYQHWDAVTKLKIAQFVSRSYVRAHVKPVLTKSAVICVAERLHLCTSTEVYKNWYIYLYD